MNTLQKTLAIVAFGCLTSVLAIGEMAHACDEKQLEQADAAIQKADSFRALEEWFHKFSGCDDGYVAEGVSDKVLSVLNENWAQLSELQQVIRSDPKVGKLILRHIDSTVDSIDLKELVNKANVSCPNIQPELCQKVSMAATAALAEQAKATKNSEKPSQP